MATSKCVRVARRVCIAYVLSVTVFPKLIHQSRECQRSHWKMHKGDCKATATNRRELEAYTKDPKSWAHFMAWLEYHHATLRNATIAALDLGKNPGADNRCFLEIQVERISAEERATKPPMAHFRVVKTMVVDLEQDTSLARIYKGTWDQRPQFIELGKRELGRSFRGTLTYIVTAHYSETKMWRNRLLSEYFVPYAKLFSVETENLGTPNPNWETILRTNIDIGHKVIHYSDVI